MVFLIKGKNNINKKNRKSSDDRKRGFNIELKLKKNNE
jgi:hypothetical protein